MRRGEKHRNNDTQGYEASYYDEVLLDEGKLISAAEMQDAIQYHATESIISNALLQ